MAYGIQHKETKEWFIGFGPSPKYEPIFGGKEQARTWPDRESSWAQKLLLERGFNFPLLNKRGLQNGTHQK